MNDPTSVSGTAKVLATIGHVCLQFSRLEILLLGLICAIENMPMAKGEIIFGGLDILPRVNMAINLAREAKLPPPLVKRLVAVRKALQDGIAERRNQVVHGAHKEMQTDSTTLTMVRWKGPKREKTLTAQEIFELGEEIFQLGNEVWAIHGDFGTWKFGPHGKKNLSNPVA